MNTNCDFICFQQVLELSMDIFGLNKLFEVIEKCLY